MFRGNWQMINPQITEASTQEIVAQANGPEDIPRYEIRYPTVNGANSASIKRIFDKIPEYMWGEIGEHLSREILLKEPVSFPRRVLAVCTVVCPVPKRSLTLPESVLIYEEFFQEQVKLFSRKQGLQSREGISIPVDANLFEKPFPCSPTT